MSAKAIEWAWAQDCAPRQKLVLLVIADAASQTGVVNTFPERLIRRKTRLKLSEVEKIVDELEEAGLLEVDHVEPHPTFALPIG